MGSGTAGGDRSGAPKRLSGESLNTILGCALTSLAALLLALAIMPMEAPEHPVAVFALILLFLFVNILLFAAVLHREMRPISVLMWLYFAYFLILPGMSQVWRDTYPWDTRLRYSDEDIVLAVLLIFVFAICYTFGHFCAQSKPLPRSARAVAPSPAMERGIILVVCSLAILFALYSIAQHGLDFFLQTRFTQGFGAEDDTIGGALLDGERGMIFGAFMFLVLLYLQTRRRRWDDQLKIVVCALAVVVIPLQTIINFPGGLARFWLFGMGFAFILAFLTPRSWLQRFIGVISFIAGTYVVFPFAAQTRLSEEYNLQFRVPDLSNYLLSGDLDGLQSLLNVIAYTKEIGFTYGKQLLTLLLFFVPRSVWVDKSLHTGMVTASFAGYGYLNVSCPIVGELYIDFGLLGVVLGGVGIGFAAARAEARYSRAVEAGALTTERLIYAVIGGFVVILTRGALEGIAAPIVGALLPYALVLAARRLVTTVAPARAMPATQSER